MKILHFLLRLYSYLFTLATSVFLAGMGVVAFLSDQHTWRVDAIPSLEGSSLSSFFLALGLFGILAVLLAFFNKFRFLHPLVTLGYLVGFVYCFFWFGYRFNGLEEFQWALGLGSGFFGNFLSSLLEFRRAK